MAILSFPTPIVPRAYETHITGDHFRFFGQHFVLDTDPPQVRLYLASVNRFFRSGVKIVDHLERALPGAPVGPLAPLRRQVAVSIALAVSRTGRTGLDRDRVLVLDLDRDGQVQRRRLDARPWSQVRSALAQQARASRRADRVPRLLVLRAPETAS